MPIDSFEQNANTAPVGASLIQADLDAFCASVEQLLQPALRGEPVAVGGGVVLAALYEARAFGVKSGMPARQARQLCPKLIFTGGHFSEYQRLGDAAIAVLADFTPDIERISIDEAFADASGSTRLFGAPADIAARMRARVLDELGLPISIAAPSAPSSPRWPGTAIRARSRTCREGAPSLKARFAPAGRSWRRTSSAGAQMAPFLRIWPTAWRGACAPRIVAARR